MFHDTELGLIGLHPFIEEGNEEILGDIVWVRSMEKLDEFHDDFIRKIVEVICEDGSKEEAFAYFRVDSVEYGKHVESGDWL